MRRLGRVAIVGLGLMGGSLGLALKRKGLARCVAGYARRQAVRRRALRIGAVDEVYADLREAARNADLVVFCVPILTIPRLVSDCASVLRAGCVVTDVGSTKRIVVAAMERALAGRDVHTVGSHPIAGSEVAGIGAARADLYRGMVVVVTPTLRTPAAPLRMVKAFWKALGARVEVLTPEKHDRVLAATSHGPHLAAAALAESVLGRDNPALCTFCGTGFRDATRIAAGSEDVWHDIAATNRKPIGRELARIEKRLRYLRRNLEKGNLASVRRFLADARNLRASMDVSRRSARQCPKPRSLGESHS
jgi:prephenate dehydrogenase